MAERGMLGLFAGASEGRLPPASRFCRPGFCPRFCPRFCPCCHSHCHLRPHPTFALTRVGLPARAGPSSLWLASGYVTSSDQGAGLRMREHCARAARQRTEQSAAASSNTEKAKWPLDAFVVCVHEVCCRMIKIYACLYAFMPRNCYHSLEI